MHALQTSLVFPAGERDGQQSSERCGITCGVAALMAPPVNTRCAHVPRAKGWVTDMCLLTRKSCPNFQLYRCAQIAVHALQPLSQHSPEAAPVERPAAHEEAVSTASSAEPAASEEGFSGGGLVRQSSMNLPPPEECGAPAEHPDMCILRIRRHHLIEVPRLSLPLYTRCGSSIEIAPSRRTHT